MSEQTPENQPSNPAPKPNETAKTFTQDDVNRLLAKQKREEFGDYAELRSAKTELDQIKESQKTEAQKSADRISELEKQLGDATAKSLRFQIASKHGVSQEDAELFLTATDEAALTKQAERLAARADERKKNGNHVPREGTNTPTSESDEREFVRELFGRSD